MGAFWTAIVDAFHAFTQQVGWLVGELVNDGGSLNSLLPLFAIGIAISVFMVGFKAIDCKCDFWSPLNALNDTCRCGVYPANGEAICPW